MEGNVRDLVTDMRSLSKDPVTHAAITKMLTDKGLVGRIPPITVVGPDIGAVNAELADRVRGELIPKLVRLGDVAGGLKIGPDIGVVAACHCGCGCSAGDGGGGGGGQG